MSTSTCKVNPLASKKGRERSPISEGDIVEIRRTLIEESRKQVKEKNAFVLTHLDNACKACPLDVKKLEIRSSTRRTIAEHTGAGAVIGLPALIIGSVPGAIMAAADVIREARNAKNVLPSCYGKFENLKELKASSLSLSNVDAVLDIAALEKLDLYGNNLTEVPDITRLPNLKELNLRKNKIKPITCNGKKVKVNTKLRGERINNLRACLSTRRR